MYDVLVLVADDDPAAALFALSGRTHTYTCSTLAAATSALEALVPDAVVLDLSLPDSSPQDSARTVRSLFAGRIVVVSSLAFEIGHEIAASIGATHLSKPYHAADLLAACTGERQ